MPKQIKLNKTYIDKIKAGPKDVYHWCSDLKGFGLRCTPMGKLVFIVQGRAKGAVNSMRITIGPFGVFTVEQARDVAREHLRTMRMGIDPRKVKAEAEAKALALKEEEEAKAIALKPEKNEIITLAAVMQDYISRPGQLKASTCAVIKRHIEVTFAAWSKEPIGSITAEMVQARYRELVTKGLRGNRPQGSPGQANQAFAILGALLAFAGRNYKRKDHSTIYSRAPVDALKDYYVSLRPRNRRVLDHKIGAVWSALNNWRDEAFIQEALTSIELVRFLLLTGVRISEATTLQWSQVNLDDAYFHLPTPKNRNPVSLPLSTQALELLIQRPRISEYVFPSWGKSGHIVEARSVMIRLSEVAGNTLSPHDLRRTFCNVALKFCRVDKYSVDLLTNHILGDVVSQHYIDTTNLQWLAPEVQKIADFLDQQAAIASGANVLALRA